MVYHHTSSEKTVYRSSQLLDNIDVTLVSCPLLKKIEQMIFLLLLFVCLNYYGIRSKDINIAPLSIFKLEAAVKK
jgi:hypothetical protein